MSVGGEGSRGVTVGETLASILRSAVSAAPETPDTTAAGAVAAENASTSTRDVELTSSEARQAAMVSVAVRVCSSVASTSRNASSSRSDAKNASVSSVCSREC